MILKQLCCICYNVVMKYNISEDIRIVCKILDISFSKLADELNVARSTVMRIVKKEVYPTDHFLESFYSFAYKNNYHQIRLNDHKIQFAQEQNREILFHGARMDIENDIDLHHSRKDIDIGIGFYMGESYMQSSSYIFMNRKSSIYIMTITNKNKLKIKEFDVSLEWMLMVSYFRGQLNEYADSEKIKNIIRDIAKYDIIVAPIADNNMYEIMNRFARGEITDKQAINALSASHLGRQIVLKTDKACKSVKLLNKLYLCKEEREDIEKERKEQSIMSLDGAKTSIEKYRRIGKYIEEILK